MNSLLLTVVFLIPLLGATNNFGYEQIKIAFFLLSISLIGLLWRGKDFRWSKINITGGVFVLILLLTSITGINPKISFLGNPPYFQGWITYVYLWLFSAAVANAGIKFDKWAVCLTGSGLLVGFLAVKDWVLLNIFNVQIPTYAGRVVSTFGQPNFYAGFLLLTLPFSYWLFKTKSGRLQYFAFAGSMIMLIGIFVSYSRSAILMALILLVVGLLSQVKMKLRVILIFVGVFVLLLALKFSSGTFGIVWNEFSYPNSHDNPDLTKMSVEKRAYIWPVAWQLFLQRPILGYGPENINESFADYFVVNKHSLFEANLNISPVLLSLKELNIDRSHNYILDLLLFSGLPGLLAWVFLVALLLRRNRGILLISFLVYLIWIQFQNQSIVHLVYFWLLVGLINKAGIDNN